MDHLVGHCLDRLDHLRVVVAHRNRHLARADVQVLFAVGVFEGRATRLGDDGLAGLATPYRRAQSRSCLVEGLRRLRF